MSRLVKYLVACVGMLVVCGAAVASPTINYQGRITAGGSDFTGSGRFKFVIHGWEGVWWANNDSNPANTNQPGGYVTIQVNNGLFSVELGNTDISGMAAINGITLQQDGLLLRTWFSTNGTTFEQLSPDVSILPCDLAHLDTGKMVVVDNASDADFRTIQEAINYVAEEGWPSTILVMPGHYPESLTFPTNRNEIFIQGAAHSRRVEIVCTNGPALRLANGTDVYLNNIYLRGAPAISDADLTIDDWNLLSLKDCDVERVEGTSGPAISLSTYGVLYAANGELRNHASGPVIAFSGGEMRISECEIEGDIGPLLTVAGSGFFHMTDCRIGGQSDQALLAQNPGGGGWGEFQNCQFEGSVIISNSASASFRPSFYDCAFGRGLFIDGGAGWGGNGELIGCRVQGATSNNALRVTGNGQVWLQATDCRVQSSYADALYVKDAEVDFKNCHVSANNGSALRLVASAAMDGDKNIGASFFGCTVENHTETTGTNDAVVVVNNSTNGADPYAECRASTIDGGIRDGVNCIDGGFDANNSTIFGNRYALVASNGQAMVFASQLSGEQDGIRLYGDVFGALWNTQVTGEGSGGVGGIGLYSDINTNMAPCIAMNSEIFGMPGPAFECAKGNWLFENCTLAASTNAAAVLRGKNSDLGFSLCGFSTLDRIFQTQNTKASIILDGTTGNTPIPRLAGCTLKTSYAPYAIDLSGGATAGNVSMVNSTLTTNLNANIGLVAPTTLQYGNVIIR